MYICHVLVGRVNCINYLDGLFHGSEEPKTPYFQPWKGHNEELRVFKYKLWLFTFHMMSLKAACSTQYFASYILSPEMQVVMNCY